MVEKKDVMEEPTRIFVLVGIIPPFYALPKNVEIMKKYYLLAAKDALPDLTWELKVWEKTEENIPAKK